MATFPVGFDAQPVMLVGVNPTTNAFISFLQSDSIGGLFVVGEGTAGTPAGGVLSVQGVSGGTKLGTLLSDGSGNAISSASINSLQRLAAYLSSEGTDGNTLPFGTLQIGGTDGTNLQALSVDTSGRLNINLIKTVLTPAAAGTATVGVTSGTALASNANRKGLIITNVSNAKISLNITGSAAVLNSGITLYPGWVWNMGEFDFTTAAINAISSVASSVLSIQEFNT